MNVQGHQTMKQIRDRDIDIISAIVDRAMSLNKSHGIDRRHLDVLMDISVVHRNICPLRLDDLLGADDGNFAHDIFGIARHLNRSTLELEDCFVPRFAR